jgi:hypothetical protein
MTTVRESLPSGSLVPVNIDLVPVSSDRAAEADTQPLSVLYESLASRESVIRAISLGTYEQSLVGEYVNWTPDSDTDTFVEFFGDTKRLLNELEIEYGIKNSGFNPFLARDLGEVQGFIHSNRVHGEVVYTDRGVTESIPREAIDDSAARVALYYADKYVSDEPCLSDLAPYNLMYGELAGDVRPDMYFVDLDPLFFQIGNAWGLQYLREKLDFWSYTVSTLDEHLQQSRVAFSILFDTLEADGKFSLDIPKWRGQIKPSPGIPEVAI